MNETTSDYVETLIANHCFRYYAMELLIQNTSGI